MSNISTGSVDDGASGASASQVAAFAAADQTVAIVLEGSVHELDLPAGAAVLTINGQDYGFDTADVIGKAPLILAGATATALPTVAGATVAYQAGPYVYDPAGGVPEIALRTVRSGAVLEEGWSHVLTGLDLVAGFSTAQDVVNSFGVSTRVQEVLPPKAYTAPALAFSGTQRLVKADGILPGGADNLLFAINFSGFSRLSGNQSLFFSLDGASASRLVLPSANSGSVGGLNILRAGGNLVINNAAIFPKEAVVAKTDLFLALLHVRVSGVWNLTVYRNGSVFQALSGSTAGTAKLSTAQEWGIGRDTAGSPLYCTIHDYRIWANVADSAVATATTPVAGYFIDGSGAARHPDIANTAYGAPRLWLPGTATAANALVNLGAAGNFTSRLGSFA